MPAAAKPRAKHRRRRRDEDDAESNVDSHTDSQSESGDSESEASGESEEEGDEEPVVVEFEEFAKATVEAEVVEESHAEPESKTTEEPVEKPVTASTKDAVPRPRPASNRAAYLAKLSSDPTFVPRVGKFWTHDQRHFGAGKVGQGDYAGLREMSEYWRDRGRGRGRGRGFVRGRGGVRPQERPQNEGKEAKPEHVKPQETTDASTVPAEDSNTPANAQPAAASTAPAAATTKSSWNGDVGRSERGSWSHDGYAELAREEERRSAARQAAIARGRGGRGMVRGMFRGRGRGAFPVPTARPESVDTSAPIEEKTETHAAPVVKLPESTFIPPTSDHEPSAITAHLQTQAEHAERLQQQELARKQQQALEDDMKRLEIGQQRVQSLGASSDAGSSSHHQPPTLLPPGIGMTESGAFFDVVTGQAVVWVPSPSPGPMAPQASFGTAMNNRMGYNPYAPSPEMGMGYGYPPQYGYQAPYSGYPRQHDPYYQQSFHPGRDSASPYQMPGYNMAPPQLTDPTYFIPPRPQSKIQIRAPASADASSRGHLNAADIAAATLKDPSKHGARSPEAQGQGSSYGYQPMTNAPYMQHAQQGYYPQQYMPMGY